MDKYSFLNAAHTVYFAELYEKYKQDPDSIEPSWRAFFQGNDFGSETFGINGEVVDGVTTQVPEHVLKEFQVVKLIDGYRTRGHLFTKTNPVRNRRKYAPTLDIENFGLEKSDLDTIFNAGDILGIGPQTLREIRKHLEDIYCDSIGVVNTVPFYQMNVQLLVPHNHVVKALLSHLEFSIYFLHLKYTGQS